MKELNIKVLLLLTTKGLIQLLKIAVCFAIPVLIAAYFYALETAICDALFTPDMSLNDESVAGLILLLPTVIPIVAAIVAVAGGIVYVIVKLASSLIQTVLSSLLSKVENALNYECVFDSILDSKIVKCVVVVIAEATAVFLLYMFFAKYDFNMNTFCYAIGGSAAFGDLIDLNEQFKMISFYLTMVVMMGTAFYYIKKNYITTY